MVMSDADKPEVIRSPAHEALLKYQQADMDGIMVITSRQAIHEVSDELATLTQRNEELFRVAERVLEEHNLSGLAGCKPQTIGIAEALDDLEKALQDTP